jgi:hypothetical protein
MKRAFAVVLLMALIGCAAKQSVVAPVPGSINALDAWAFRIISDSTASIHSVKIWEQCTALSFPITVNVDGATELCDPKSGAFPMQYKDQLNMAINALNTASAVGKAYHSGATSDATGLNAAISQLTSAVTQLMSKVGGGK